MVVSLNDESSVLRNIINSDTKELLRIKKDAATCLIQNKVDYAALLHLYILFQVKTKQKSNFNTSELPFFLNETTSKVFKIHHLISTYCRLKNKRNIDRYSLTGFVNIHVNQMNLFT